mgnify:CR=1 FL=1
MKVSIVSSVNDFDEEEDEDEDDTMTESAITDADRFRSSERS